MSDKIKAAFATELTKSDPQVNLARAALLMSGYLGKTSEIVPYLDRLDVMAQTVQPAVEAADTDLEIINSLNYYLFNGLNFYGNSADYYHPDNSFLNKVLDSKTGIPISLSMVYMEVGWRLELPLWGIGMPGHFIVGYGTSINPIYIDVFDEGRILSEDDCLNICKVPPANRVDFRAQYLKPTARKDILFRMLLNLKQVYVRREDWKIAYKISDLMLLVRPDEISEIRDRGLMAYRLNRLHDAIFDISRYLFLAPDSIDASWLEQRLEKMDETLIRLN